MGDPLRILVMLADRAEREALTEGIRALGHVPAPVQDLEEALTALRGSRVDCLLLESGGDELGMALAECVRTTHPDLPVMLLLAQGTQQEVVDSLGVCAEAVLRRPLDPAALRAALSDVAQRAPEGRGLEVISATPQWIEVSIPCDPGYVRRMRRYIENLEAGLSEKERTALVFAFGELATNAVEHGGRGRDHARVTIACYRFSRVRIFRILDQGEGFDSAATARYLRDPPDPARLQDTRRAAGLRPGGLGISAVHNFADHLIHNHKGNEVVLVKYIQENEPAGEAGDVADAGATPGAEETPRASGPEGPA